MIREKPYQLERGNLSKREWGEALIQLWNADGCPEVLGRAEIQVHLARQYTEWDDKRKPATRKGKQ